MILKEYIDLFMGEPVKTNKQNKGESLADNGITAGKTLQTVGNRFKSLRFLVIQKMATDILTCHRANGGMTDLCRTKILLL